MIVLFFLLGTAIGSFLNVLIYRIPKEEQFIGNRSYCPVCKHQLAWFDLIPLLSWVILRARCRYCKAKISWQYPAVELGTGLLFVFAFCQVTSCVNYMSIDILFTQYVPAILFAWFILSALVVIFVVDLKHYIIPDKILYPTILIALIYRFVQLVAQGLFFPVSLPAGRHGSIQYPVSGTHPIFSSLGAAGFFLILVLITRGKGMGIGDVKFVLLMGLLLGYPGIIVGLYIAFLTGAVVSVILILLKKKKFGQHIPFGPFLVAGTVVGMYYGEMIWKVVTNI